MLTVPISAYNNGWRYGWIRNVLHSYTVKIMVAISHQKWETELSQLVGKNMRHIVTPEKCIIIYSYLLRFYSLCILLNKINDDY